MDRMPHPLALPSRMVPTDALFWYAESALPVFRPIVPLQLGLPEWVEDPHFDRDYHLLHLSLPAPGSRRQLLDLTGQILATPLDRQRPLWPPRCCPAACSAGWRAGASGA